MITRISMGQEGVIVDEPATDTLPPPGVNPASEESPEPEGHELKETFRTLSEGLALAKRLAQLCPQPERTEIGLRELLINALEHGCLGITYEEKSRLLEMGADEWEKEVDRRLSLPGNAGKMVDVQVECTDGEIRFLITDTGNGFDWIPYLEIDDERGSDHHGRGIFLARQMSFKRLEYRGSGNQVLAVV